MMKNSTMRTMKTTTGSSAVWSSERTSARRCHSAASPVRMLITASTPALTPPAEVALLEAGRHGGCDDHLCERIGQRAFEPIADLDANFSFLRGDKQQHA